jgi:F-type H+-transporting ATPase subunit delta
VNGPVARRYAKAFFELAVEHGGIEEKGAELARLAELFRKGELAALAESATVDVRTKGEIVRAIGERLGAAPLVVDFLVLLAAKNRLRSLPDIDHEYQRLLDGRLGRMRARISSAAPLPEETIERIRALFEAKTGKKILASVVVAPELIGGVVVEVEGRVYDGSVSTQLERLRTSLSENA